MTEQHTRTPNTKCIICDAAIYRRPGQMATSGGNAFCSSKCYGFSCRDERPCVVCGMMMLASLNKKTCSRECANKNRAGMKYKLGRPLKDVVRSNKALKIRLLKTKGKKCERCLYSRFEILQVHHKNRDRKDNRLENLELICPNCHYEEHLLEKSWLKKYPL